MVALYARQSLDVKDSISTEMQIEKAAAMCSSDEVFQTYIDKGYSGKNTNRPQFTKMLDDIRDGLIHKVVVYKLDRFSRSILDFSNLWDFLSKHKVEFISVNEKFDTSTPMGRAMIFIIMVFAQLERDTIAERVTDNYYERAKQGSWMGGPAPYGFEIGRLRCGKRVVPTLEINPDQIQYVREIFSHYANQDIALGKLAKWLNESQIAGVSRDTWNNVTLARILRNPCYVKADADIYAYYKALGVNLCNTVEEFEGIYAGLLVGKRGASSRQRKELAEATFSIANWEGIIDSDVWLRCQAKLKENEQIKNTGKSKVTWMSGLLKCGECGRSIRTILDCKSPTGKRYLRCTGRNDNNCDHIVQLKIDDIESFVAIEIQKLMDNCSDEVEQEFQIISNQDKIELQQIEESIENLMNSLSKGATELTIAYINKELEKLDNRQKELTEKAIVPQKKKVVLDKLIFKKVDFEDKKRIAKAYILKVLVYKEHIEIIWNI